MRMERRRRAWLAVSAWALALALHIALVLRQYPPTVFLAHEPPVKGDISRYFATAHAAAQCGGQYGYDPYFLAGYPVGLWNSIGGKGYEVLHRGLPGLALPALFYLALVGMGVICPLLAWLGTRRFCGSRRAEGILLALLLVYWHLSTMVAYFWSYGNEFFPAMSCLLPVLVGLAWDILGGRRPLPAGLMLGLVGTVIVYGHPVALIAGIVPLALTAWWQREGWRRPAAWAGLGIAAAIGAALCLWWAVPLLAHRSDALALPKPWLQSSWKHLVMDIFSDRAYRHPFDRNILEHAALLLAIVGMIMTWRGRTLWAALGAGGVTALAIAYGGSYWAPTASLQNYRFLVPAVILLLFPATRGLEWAWERFRAPGTPRALVVLLLLLMAPAFIAYLMDLLQPPLPCGVPQADRQVYAALRDMPVRGRVLCDDMMLGHMIPYVNGTPVIGGLQPYLKHYYATLDLGGRLFGRGPRDWNPQELRTYLARYAIDAAVFTMPGWVRFADQHPDLFAPAGRVGSRALYRVLDASPSLVLEGEAEATATYNRIDVRDVRSPVLVLKLHHATWMTTDQGVRVEPVRVPDDPVPFIRCLVPPGVQAFIIRKSESRP